MSKLKLRSYIISDDKIIRVGNDSNSSTKYPQMADRKGIIVRAYFEDIPFLNLVSITTGMVFFNSEGQWEFEPIENMKVNNVINHIFNPFQNVKYASFSPRLGFKEKEIFKK